MLFSALPGVVCAVIPLLREHPADLSTLEAYLGVPTRLEEWGDADEADLIVPHDGVLTIVDPKGVAEDCVDLSVDLATDEGP